MKKEVTIPTWMIIDAFDSVWPNRNFLANNYLVLKEKISDSLQNK